MLAEGKGVSSIDTIAEQRPAAWQHWSAALCVIAMKLNGERVPKHR